MPGRMRTELRSFWSDRCFWSALVLSLGFHASWLTLWGAVHYLLPVTPPVLLLPYGDSSVAGLSVSTLAVDSGSLYQAHEDRPGGEVLRGPLNRDPAPPAGDEAQLAEPKPTAMAQIPNPFLEPDASLLEPMEDTDERDDEASEPPPPMEVEDRKPDALPRPATPPPPVKTADIEKPKEAATAKGAAQGLRAPNGVGTDPKEAPGLGKAKGAQGSSKMAPGTPSAGGRVGYTHGVTMMTFERPSYPPDARRAGIEGTVLVRLQISAEGVVTEAKLQTSSGHSSLDAEAVRFAYTVRFSPARLITTPVASTATLPVVFRLID